MLCLISFSTLSDVEGHLSSYLAHTLERPESLIDNCTGNNLNGYQSARPLNYLNIPIKPGLPVTEYETQLDNLTLKPQQQGTSS